MIVDHFRLDEEKTLELNKFQQKNQRLPSFKDGEAVLTKLGIFEKAAFLNEGNFLCPVNKDIDFLEEFEKEFKNYYETSGMDL